MATSDARHFERLLQADASLAQFRSQRVKVGALERGMGFRGGTKVDLNPEMKLYDTTPEPTPTAPGKFDRLWNFPHAQDPGVEAARSSLARRRHGELNVIDGEERSIAGLHFPGRVHRIVA